MGARAACGEVRFALRAWLCGVSIPLLLLTAAATSAAATQSEVDPDAAELVAEDAGAAQTEAERAKQAHEQELQALTRDISLTEERQAELKREIDAINRDRDTLNADLLRTAQRVHALEGELDATEERLGRLRMNVVSVRASLNDRRGVLAEVLATLQRIGRRPPPALAVRPKDALAAVRSAMLLNAVMPEIRTEAEALAGDLQQLTSLHDDIAGERDRLKSDSMRLAEERSRVELLIEAKREQETASREKLEAESARAQELAQAATSLQDLIRKLEAEIGATQQAARDAAEHEARTRAAHRDDDPFADPGRLSPAITFARAKGLLGMPVNGAVLRDFGTDDGFGAHTQGMSIAARSGASVTAPADGWVVYAGPFRSYGQLLILNAGGGYHVLLAGMDRIDVDLGQFVLAGEPVAVMGIPKLASATMLDLGSTRPVLYIEFRKDGTSIDPAPWWARPEDEKVRG
ncbi:hypothetical protein D1F64_01380 [Breoghania sp. L-A4]|nr:hypothetical protein D1F64_01380 [Breoghania sp. L-A4]